MTYLSGSQPGLDLEINKNSLDLDLAKTSNLRIRIKPKPIYTSLDNQDSFRINMYEIIEGNRNFLTSRNATVNKESRRNKVISIDAGRFITATKELEFDLFDTEGELINTYAVTITAENLGTQIAAAPASFQVAECDNNDFDCLIEGIFERVSFEAKKQRQATTGFEKEDSGRYKVSIPVPLNSFKVFRGRRVNPGGSKLIGDGSGGAFSSAFGETIDASFVRIGQNINNHTSLGYSNGLNLSFIDGGTDRGIQFHFSEDGKLGIGTDSPEAFLHLPASLDPNTPSLIIEQGSLTSATPPNGSIEFDGNNLYLTKGGTRSVIGAQGPTGPQGPAGATGAQGPKGDAGTITANSGATINGDSSIEGNLFVNGNVTITGLFNGDGSTIKNLNVQAATVNGGDLNDVTLNGSTLEGTTTIDGAISFTDNGSIDINSLNSEGNLIQDVVYVDASGNVGIGNGATSSSEKLVVQGDVKAVEFHGTFNGNLVSSAAINASSVNGDSVTAGTLRIKSSDITDIEASDTIPVSNGVMRIQGSDGVNPAHVDLVSDPQIAAGAADGQLLIIRGMNDSAKVTIEDGAGVLLSAGVQFQMGANDTLTLIYDALNGQWIEITRSDR